VVLATNDSANYRQAAAPSTGEQRQAASVPRCGSEGLRAFVGSFLLLARVKMSSPAVPGPVAIARHGAARISANGSDPEADRPRFSTSRVCYFCISVHAYRFNANINISASAVECRAGTCPDHLRFREDSDARLKYDPRRVCVSKTWRNVGNAPRCRASPP